MVLIGLLLVPLASMAGQAAAVGPPGTATAASASHELRTILVADVELVDLAPPDQRYDEAEDATRTNMVSKRVRAAVAASKRYRVIDRGEADRQPPHSYADCTACFVDWARKQGADLVLVTTVQKESRLILAVNMALIDVAHPNKAVSGGSVELRGDTDEEWLAGAGHMLSQTLDVPLAP